MLRLEAQSKFYIVVEGEGNKLTMTRDIKGFLETVSTKLKFHG